MTQNESTNNNSTDKNDILLENSGDNNFKEIRFEDFLSEKERKENKNIIMDVVNLEF